VGQTGSSATTGNKGGVRQARNTPASSELDAPPGARGKGQGAQESSKRSVCLRYFTTYRNVADCARRRY
jgi:hypothetical protein